MTTFTRLALCLTVLFTVSVRAEDNGLKNESEAGVVLTGGNTETTTISLKQTSTYIADLNSYKFFGNYLRSSNRGVEQALTWGLGLRYERGLSDNLSLFLGQLVESNIYQSIQQRYATDLGAKYKWRDLETFKWSSELGYRFTRENYTSGTVPFKNINFARLYNEIQYFFSKTVSTKWWIEFLPNITESDAYQLNSELSLSAALSDTFSVKSGYLVKYNNHPPDTAAFRTDSTFTTALVAKF